MNVSVFTPQETMNLLRDAMNKEGNNFRIKIWHRAAQNYQEMQIATFDGATLEQIEVFEEWILQLFDSCPGTWSLHIFHGVQRGQMYGAPLKFVVDGTPGKKPVVNWGVLDSEKYSGPRDIKTPLRPETAKAPEAPKEQGLPNNQLGSKEARDAASLAASLQGADRAEAIRLQNIAMTLDQQMKALEVQRQELRDQKMRDEMRAEMRAMQPVAVAAPTREPDQTIPLIMKMMEAAEARAAAAQLQMAQFMDRAMTRPAIDPVTQKILDRLEKMSENTKPAGQEQVIGLIGTVSSMASQMIASQAELMSSMNGPEESGLMKLAQQGLAALPAIMAAQSGTKAPQLALPSGQPQLAGMPEEQKPKRKLTKIEALQRIIYMKAPANEVYARFRRALRDEQFRGIVMKHNSDWPSVAQEVLGPWAIENLNYLQETLPQVLGMAMEEGLIVQAPPKKEAPPQQVEAAAVTNFPKKRKERNGAPKDAVQAIPTEVVETAPSASAETVEPVKA